MNGLDREHLYQILLGHQRSLLTTMFTAADAMETRKGLPEHNEERKSYEDEHCDAECAVMANETMCAELFMQSLIKEYCDESMHQLGRDEMGFGFGAADRKEMVRDFALYLYNLTTVDLGKHQIK